MSINKNIVANLIAGTSNVHAWANEIDSAWVSGNNAGEGFAVGTDDDPIAVAGCFGMDRLIDVIGSACGDTAKAVYVDGDDLVVVGDVYGPWAVRLNGNG
jgi:hypothetical protein